jgi:protein-S-isoprenylcysteine O-methyltransferase Ste14
VTALATTVILIAMLVLRLLDEEKLLCAELPGYTEYCARVRWRLVPKVY